MRESILETLEYYVNQGHLPMHMPGHKRNLLAPYLDTLCARLDITEIDGFDNLHAPQGLLWEAQSRAAALWGADESYFLVNGSSGGILAGLYAATRRGDEILVARNVHKSVFHAIELCGLIPHFFLPPVIPGTDIFGGIRDVRQAIAAHPGVKLLLLTSPTYEGALSDLAGIRQICHENGIFLMVDEAHGAHLGLGGGFPEGAVKAGADLVVQSLHKTLPSLTQTAILHRNGSRVSPERLRHALSVFQTSSPSYLLMASIDGCVRLLAQQPELLAQWREALDEFHALSLKQLRIGLGVPCDPGKLVISGCSGYALADALRHRFSIEVEMAAPGYALAMTGAGDTKDTLRRLADALGALDGSLPENREPAMSVPAIPEMVMASGDALACTVEFVPPKKAVGRIAGEYLWAYPPGIPLLTPGERIGRLPTGQIQSTYGRFPDFIAVVR